MQLVYADNLNCVSTIPEVLLETAWFTTGSVRMVGQEPAPKKCVLMRKSKTARVM